MTENFYNVVLDGNLVKGIPGETILELAKRHGIEIPTLCNDDRLEPFTSCYVCVVEVEGMRGHQPSCSTKIAEGMKVITYNEGIHKSRRTALELMLSNHYADCMGPCKQTCPAGVDVQGYISLIEKGLYNDAVALIKETNPLPAICGRVCVRPCERECRRNLLDEGSPVGIDYLKRYASDIDLESSTKFVPKVKQSTGKRVAVIGAGPGGLSAAHFLQIEGHQVDIFEAAPKSGGWLRYGIPEYRLPNDILDKEVKNITDLGVNIFYNQKLGDNLSYKNIQEKYDATILTIGSQKGTGIGCEGDDAQNVFSGIDFLKNMEMTGQHFDFSGKTIAVIGGGNTAMDCCRTSIRCHGKKVYVIYRRTEKEMPANPIEIHESKLEGVEYLFLTLPKKITKNEKGEIKSMTCIKMELGEPDASGRRRPVPVEGSDFEIELDYAFAAIGQKTDVNFIDDINEFAKGGKLIINKWGDIDASKDTLQTGIPSVFAAGDGVTGPATIIEAIAQAKVASTSAHQFLMGLPIQPEKKPFISKRDNFKKQVAIDYLAKYEKQFREEMPTLPPDNRINFKEVELGYEGEDVAKHETQRCLECGCTAFFDCDLQKYSTEYDARQTRFNGEYKEFQVDFRHPYIEIDNNKCILCARCVRICHEVVGADALGLVNRGFDTYVAPSMGDALQETHCESCGMCISTCPTGAMLENVIFKPGPIKTDTADIICNYCSVGCSLTLHHKKGFVMGVSGNDGVVNHGGNLCKFGKFGYTYLNRADRILTPLHKVNGSFLPITFEEAYQLLQDKIDAVDPDENAFFAGARLSNEELFLIQKLARSAVGTNNIGSFHYLNRGRAYIENHELNVPFDELKGASKIYLLGTELNDDNGVAGFFVNNARVRYKIPVSLITTKPVSSMYHKVDELVEVDSYYHFIKAVNHYLLAKGVENGLFIRDRVEGFEGYKAQLLSEDYSDLLDKAGVNDAFVAEFAQEYNEQMNAVMIFAEKDLSSNACYEAFNLALITGKLGKTSNGILTLKEKNNAQGLFDMGIDPTLGIGGVDSADPYLVENLKAKWNMDELPESVHNLQTLLNANKVKNIFIFGEDPVGCALKEEWRKTIESVDFVVVQDGFMTPTAEMADLILPASFAAETGGTCTNTQRVIQDFDGGIPGKITQDTLTQVAMLMGKLGVETPSTKETVFGEIITLLPANRDHSPLKLIHTESDNNNYLFNFGCDALFKWTDEQFKRSFTQA